MDPENKNFQKNGKSTWRYYHFTNINNSHTMYGSWDVKCNTTEFCVILDWFLLFYPLSTQKIKILKKSKNCLEILSFYTGVTQITITWYMVPEVLSTTDNFLSFWTIFCPFTPLTVQKIKILKKWKKHLEISSFYICVSKIIIRWYTVPEKWCAPDGRTDRKSDT